MSNTDPAGNAPRADAPQAIILAGGQGKRMGGDLPKVLYEVAGRPMLHWVIDACRAAGVSRCVVVVGYKAQLVRDALAGTRDVVFVGQIQQLGTGHAARMARPLFDDGPACDVFVLAGDGPLIRRRTLARMLDAHRRSNAAATLATAVLADPTGYGRVLRDAAEGFVRIVEQKDASPEQLAVREVNPSYYCFRSDALFAALERVGNDNRQGEFYLTDVPALLRDEGRTVTLVDAVPAEDVLSINTPEQLAEVGRILQSRPPKEAPAWESADANPPAAPGMAPGSAPGPAPAPASSQGEPSSQALSRSRGVPETRDE